MSWREVLGVAIPRDTPYTQNTHNTQKCPEPSNSADIAYFAEEDSKLLEALANATRGLFITPAEVRDALAPEDIEDWNRGDIGAETLAAFARSLVQRREMDQGKVPSHYTERAICRRCGPIWLWFSGEVLGCPWCWNRATGKSIPRPCSVHCGDCIHFERIDHPHLGHCAKGEPKAIAGLWDSDRRYCEKYQTIQNEGE
jgi:hypothetical protein